MPGQQKSQQFGAVDRHYERIFRGASSLTRDKPVPEQAEVVDAYYDRIFRGALSLTWDRHLAEDIVQETFLSAFRKFDSFSGKSSVFTWLYRIMLNKYRDHYRKKSLLRRLGFVRAAAAPDQTNTAKSDGPSPAAELAISEERQLMKHAMDNLPSRLREVVVMYYLDDLPLGEIARILNRRPGTVKFRLFDARKRLHHALQGKLNHGPEKAVPGR